MDKIVLQNRVLQYVSSRSGLLDYSQVSIDLNISKDELQYALNLLGEEYFTQSKSGFFATNKAKFEGKNSEIIQPLSEQLAEKQINQIPIERKHKTTTTILSIILIIVTVIVAWLKC